MLKRFVVIKMATLKSKEFMEILHKACETDDMDSYLNMVLMGYRPYDLVFKVRDKEDV